ncbi:MAG: EpsG family protein [Solibacillus sp.]
MEENLSIYIDKKYIKKFFFIICSLLISTVLVLPGDVTWARDRDNYLIYAHSSLLTLERYLGEGILAVFSNEPLFLLINIILEFLNSPELTVKIIIFMSSMIVLLCLGKLTDYNPLVIVLFLILPQVIKNHIIHLRQGLALGVYLLSFIPIKGKKIAFLRYIAPFIHSSFLFLLFFEFLEKTLKFLWFNFIPRMVFSVGLIFFLIQSVPFLAILMQDRRAQEYDFSMTSGASGLGLLVWIGVAFIFILIVDKGKLINVICCYGLSFYILSYFFLDFGARVFESILPLMIVATLNVEDKESKAFLVLLLIAAGVLSWLTNGIGFLV